MKRIKKNATIVFATLFVFFLGYMTSSAMTDQPHVEGEVTLSAPVIEQLVNIERQKAGLNTLTHSEKLSLSACAKADDMIARKYWSHNAPDGTTPWHFYELVAYKYREAGENLAYDMARDAVAVESWMNSPTHKANILGNYTESGVCVRNSVNYQGEKTNLIVQHFAIPQ